MKTQFLLAAISLISGTNAFWGKMEAGGYITVIPGPTYQQITLTDYTTGSTYYGTLDGGFNNCVNKRCPIHFSEMGKNKWYNFDATMWRTNDGCHNIDFQGALDAHHGYCCGKLPCNFGA